MREKILSQIKERSCLDGEDNVEEATLYEAMIDSLDMVELVMDVEKEFSVLINDNTINSFNGDTKVKEMVDVLVKAVEDEKKNKG